MLGTFISSGRIPLVHVSFLVLIRSFLIYTKHKKKFSLHVCSSTSAGESYEINLISSLPKKCNFRQQNYAESNYLQVILYTTLLLHIQKLSLLYTLWCWWIQIDRLYNFSNIPRMNWHVRYGRGDWLSDNRVASAAAGLTCIC